MAKPNAYQGPERRIHKVYVTRHTEYHVRRGVCIAVRDRKQGSPFVTTHHALKMRLEGHIKPGTMLPEPGPPPLGFRIYFADRNDDVVTSPVVAVLRPPKTVVAQYPPEE